MAWELRENEDGSWSWEAIQSAYGLVCGTEDTLAMAAARLGIAEAELVEDGFPEHLKTWFLERADEHLQAVRFGLIDEIGRHVHPLDPDGFTRTLRGL